MSNKTISNKGVYKIEGMDCASCASLIELDLEEAGITARCSYPKQTLEINSQHDIKKVKEIITKSGYNLLENE